MRVLRERLGRLDDESGMTLIEMLVATVMSVIVVGASCAMLISAVKDQPALSRKAQNVTTARFQLERVVREVRKAVRVEKATPTEVELLTRPQRVSCGSKLVSSPNVQRPQCRVLYRCSATSCTRTEANEAGTPVGTTTVALSGLGVLGVFCFVPSSNADPSECGPPRTGEGPPTYVGVNLQIPNPEGPGLLTISDGATLRTEIFS
jgi:type II secretory pathway pseudopilin PulG